MFIFSVERYKDKKELGKPRPGSMPTTEPKKGPKEMIDPLPDPILVAITPERASKKNGHRTGSPISTILSILKSSDVHRGKGSSVDWDSLVEKLHESLEEQELYDTSTNNQPTTSFHHPQRKDAFDIPIADNRLAMTGERVKKSVQDHKRPKIKVSAPTHPNYVRISLSLTQ